MSRSCSAEMPAAGSVGAREVFVLTAEAPAPLDTKRWASHFMSLRESWKKWHESWKYDIQKVVIRESQGVIQRV